MEEMGMTDLQYKSHLMDLVAELERARALTENEEAREILDSMIKRYMVTIES